MTSNRLTPEAVRWGYRLLLEREPEDMDVIRNSLVNHELVSTFVDQLLSSEEFRGKRSRSSS